jgi:hypothetical protein
MRRKWIGPALLQRVKVEGFDTGIAVANTEYGITLDHIDLHGQHKIGLENTDNAISAAHVTIDTPGQPIVNRSPKGLIVLVQSDIADAGEADAMANRGTVVADGLRLPGKSEPVTGVFQDARLQPSSMAHADLPDAPAPPDDPASTWVNVTRYATPSGGDTDITEALRRAMASGASTIYLPYGHYTITDGISVPPTLRRIIGFNSSITVSQQRNPAFSRDAGMLRIDQPGPPVTIDRLVFDMTNLGDQLGVQQTTARDLVLRDVVMAGTMLLNRTEGGGRTFIENTCCASIRVAGPAPVYARQLDTEGGGTRIIDNGAPLVVLGIKTEGNCTVLDNRNGARSTILGGLLYIVRDASPGVPAFRNQGGSLQASFLEESFRAGSRYQFYLDDPTAHRVIPATDFPSRGYGRVVPLLTTGP